MSTALQLVSEHLNNAAPTAHFVADGLNPFYGVKADLGPLGPAFDATWKKLLAAAYGVVFIYLGFHALAAVAQWVQAKKQHYDEGMASSAKAVKQWGVATLTCVLLPVIFGALVSLGGDAKAPPEKNKKKQATTSLVVTSNPTARV